MVLALPHGRTTDHEPPTPGKPETALRTVVLATELQPGTLALAPHTTPAPAMTPSHLDLAPLPGATPAPVTALPLGVVFPTAETSVISTMPPPLAATLLPPPELTAAPLHPVLLRPHPAPGQTMPRLQVLITRQPPVECRSVAVAVPMTRRLLQPMMLPRQPWAARLLRLVRVMATMMVARVTTMRHQARDLILSLFSSHFNLLFYFHTAPPTH